MELGALARLPTRTKKVSFKQPTHTLKRPTRTIRNQLSQALHGASGACGVIVRSRGACIAPHGDGQPPPPHTHTQSSVLAQVDPTRALLHAQIEPTCCPPQLQRPGHARGCTDAQRRAGSTSIGRTVEEQYTPPASEQSTRHRPRMHRGRLAKAGSG